MGGSRAVLTLPLRSPVQATSSQTGCVNASLATPIFVVGMPRSGSTLLEQLLGSHSWAWAAGGQLTRPLDVWVAPARSTWYALTPSLRGWRSQHRHRQHASAVCTLAACARTGCGTQLPLPAPCRRGHSPGTHCGRRAQPAPGRNQRPGHLRTQAQPPAQALWMQVPAHHAAARASRGAAAAAVARGAQQLAPLFLSSGAGHGVCGVCVQRPACLGWRDGKRTNGCSHDVRGCCRPAGPGSSRGICCRIPQRPSRPSRRPAAARAAHRGQDAAQPVAGRLHPHAAAQCMRAACRAPPTGHGSVLLRPALWLRWCAAWPAVLIPVLVHRWGRLPRRAAACCCHAAASPAHECWRRGHPLTPAAAPPRSRRDGITRPTPAAVHTRMLGMQVTVACHCRGCCRCVVGLGAG